MPSAAIYDASNKLFKQIRAEVGVKIGKLSRKRFAALYPFGVRVGPLVEVRKVAILLSYNFIADYVFTLLITFPLESLIP